MGGGAGCDDKAIEFQWISGTEHLVNPGAFAAEFGSDPVGLIVVQIRQDQPSNQRVINE